MNIKLPLVALLILISNISYADVIYLKNGNKIVGKAREEGEKGYWIDGIFFTKDEVEKVEMIDNSASPNATLEVSGIMMGAEPVAVVNNEVVQAGQKIGKAKVVEITDSFVKFDIDGTTVIKEIATNKTEMDRDESLRQYRMRMNRNRNVASKYKQGIDERKSDELEQVINEHYQKAKYYYLTGNSFLNEIKYAETRRDIRSYAQSAISEYDKALNEVNKALLDANNVSQETYRFLKGLKDAIEFDKSLIVKQLRKL